MNNFREVLSGIDVKPLLKQLAGIPTAKPQEETLPYGGPPKWRRRTEWTFYKRGSAIYNEYNIVLQHGSARLHNASRNVEIQRRKPHPEGTLSEAWPIVHAVNKAVGGDPEGIGHVIITRMRRGQSIAGHVDEHPTHPGFPPWKRHQIPLQVSPHCIFWCGAGDDREEIWMKPGQALWFDRSKIHGVENGGGDRLTMIAELLVA